MDDSLISPVLLSSSAHLENVAQLIKNIEEQTLIADELSNLSNEHSTKETLTKSISSLSPNIAPFDSNLLTKSIPLINSAPNNDGTHTTEYRLSPGDSNDLEEPKKQPFSLTNYEHDTGYAWDDQYDPRTNYRFTFGADKSQPTDTKSEKARRYKHRSTSQKISPLYSDEELSPNITNNMNDWSMRSSSNTLEQSVNQPQQVPSVPPPSSSSQQQSAPANNSSGSSTTSSSTSWRQMKESQRATTGTDSKEARPPSPMCLYKIFQQKSTTTPSSTTQSAFSFHRLRKDLLNPTHTNEASKDTSKSRLSADQAIQTSMLICPSTNTRHRTTSGTAPKSEAFEHLTSPTPTLIHKSLPDLSFISQYSKELPRSRTTSPSAFFLNNIQIAPSPTVLPQPKQDSDRPRTLKSIKRYKNNKHSTEPLGVFYSPQLRKTFAAVPVSTGLNALPSNDSADKSPSLSTSQTSHRKSCLKPGSRANSCDIQKTIEEQKSPLLIPRAATDTQSVSSSSSPCIRRSAGVEKLKHLDTVWSSKISNKLSAYVLPNSSRGHHSEHDLISIIPDDYASKKSISFSEDISSQHVSPCNPTIAFTDNLPLPLYESNQRLTKRTTMRYRDMRRCQTDIIVVDPVLHLHSFTDSPPNEFCLQRDDDDDDNDDNEEELLMEKSTINIIPNLDEPMPVTEAVPPSPVEKEIKPSKAMNTSTLDNIVETISCIAKRLFELKQTDKAIFLDNEQNAQLDPLLKTDLCSAIQTILEHGRKDLKKVSLWKIIESSIDKNPSATANTPFVYQEGRLFAQSTSSYWLYKFQAFIFFLLNKNELVNWLYFFTRQKDVLQRYYQSPDALILVSIASTFNLFERIMTQLEKLTILAFRLTYHTPDTSASSDEQLTTSFISIHPTKASARDWVMTISRRAPKTFAQPIVQAHSNDTFRSTLSRRLNALFNKTNPPSPALATKLPEPKRQSKSPGPLRRARFPSVFSNTATTAPTSVPTPKVKYSLRESTPPSTRTSVITQSKIPRPSLNVDKPKSARYRSTAPSLN